MKISNWGNYPVIEAEKTLISDIQNVKALLAEKSKSYITRGLGRSYGDASLFNNIISSVKFNRFISFNQQSGILEAEAGVSLADILDVFVPKGWFLPVTPGTKFVTLGGAIAADVHGKNHHKEGSFCKHVSQINILSPDGNLLVCNQNENKQLFKNTCGGMGLTGFIVSAKLKLKKIETAYISQKIFKAKNLDNIFDLFESTKNHTYSVAWIDCLAKGINMGKSVLFIGEHTSKNELHNNDKKKDNPFLFNNVKNLSIPFNFPAWFLNSMTIKTFNFFYYFIHNEGKESIVPYEPFFYPLDKIMNWNRMYGKKGFLQYQFVLPLANSYEGLKEILEKTAKNRSGSFLAVLKLFGKQNNSMSFPEEGYTLALDFPVSKGVFEFLDEMDKIVLKYGGKIYLAKDARMSAGTFKKSYGIYLDDFKKFRKSIDPGNKFKSLLSERLKIDQ